jgi:hypothetical protein
MKNMATLGNPLGGLTVISELMLSHRELASP